MSDIKIAVYTSFYNCTKYIDQLFDNVLDIKYDNWTWFITDDFSTDGTGDIIREKSKENKRIVYVDQTRKKEMYWQPNNFIPLDYEYIMLVCADDIVDPEILNIYSNYIKKFNRDISILSTDFSKIDEETGKVHSRGYVLNNENFIKKLDTYHPSIDYVSNLSYYPFGHAMCFKNTSDLEFEIDDFDASAEDSYRMMYMLGKGRWLHIPRNLYKWTYRENSESHSPAKSNFNGNFQVAYDKCLNNICDPVCYFNDCFKELNSLISIEDIDRFKSISIFSPNLNVDQKRKIKELYPEKNIVFNIPQGCEFYIIISNYYEPKDSLEKILSQIGDFNDRFSLLVYNLDENFYLDSDNMLEGNNKRREMIGNSISGVFGGYAYFSYFRHLIFTLDR